MTPLLKEKLKSSFPKLTQSNQEVFIGPIAASCHFVYNLVCPVCALKWMSCQHSKFISHQCETTSKISVCENIDLY